MRPRRKSLGKQAERVIFAGAEHEDFNEAQAEKPGKTSSSLQGAKRQISNFNEAQAEKPGKTAHAHAAIGPALHTSMRPRRKSLGKRSRAPALGLARAPDFNEAQAEKPGKTGARDHSSLRTAERTSMRPRRKSLGKRELGEPQCRVVVGLQ